MNRIDVDLSEEESQVALARRNVYGLLAQIFLGKFDKVLDKNKSNLKSLIETDDIFSFFDKILKSDSKYIKIEYDNVFAVPGDSYIPPYESAYNLSINKKETDQERDLSLEGFYHTINFDPSSIVKKRSDHIGLELGFMEAAIHGETQARRRKDKEKVGKFLEIERKFLLYHLKPFLAEISDNASDLEAEVIKEMIDFASDFINWDWENNLNLKEV